MVSRTTTSRWRAGRIAWMTLVLTALVVSVGYGVRAWARPRPVDLSGVSRAVVHRSDLQSTVRAPGRIESVENTTIECELEAVYQGTRNGVMRTGGASTIIELIPDGSTVEKGEVLCRLDSSDYEELVRQQEMEVQRVRAALQGAILDLESVKAALREYREGTLVQTRERFQGNIAIAESNVKSQRDRLAWTERMAGIGYVPASRLAAERQNLDRYQILLDQTQLAYDNLEKFTAPRTTFTLESRIVGYESVVTYQTLRLKRVEDRLDYLKEQVDHCTIRAPHDGFVIYANAQDDDTRIELGATVRQRQDLFWLPDLSRMQVETVLAQSVVDRVNDGMPAVVCVEALPYVRLEGVVESVSPLPMSKVSHHQSDDVKNYLAKVTLQVIPEGLRPGMTAEVEVVTANRDSTLVVPQQAVAVEDGEEVCYVDGPTGPERRRVGVGEVTPEELEILEGLEEGEQVILEPQLIRETVLKGKIVDGPASPDGARANRLQTADL